jgi:hypothetical protein
MPAEHNRPAREIALVPRALAVHAKPLCPSPRKHATSPSRGPRPAPSWSRPRRDVSAVSCAHNRLLTLPYGARPASAQNRERQGIFVIVPRPKTLPHTL